MSRDLLEIETLPHQPATAPFAEYYVTPFKAAAASFAVDAIAAPVRNTSELESVVAGQGTRARWWPYRYAGGLHERPSRGGHVAGGSLPSPPRLSAPFL